MRVIIIILLSVTLFGCSKNYHLRQSEKHYKKAIFKGYEPTKDTYSINNNIQPIQVRFNDTVRTKYIKGISNLLIKEKPLNAIISSERNFYKNRTDILNYKIDSILLELEKEILLDSTFTFQDGSNIKVSLKNGYLSIDSHTLARKEKIYIATKEKIYINPFDTFLNWFRPWKIVIFGFLLGILYLVYRFIKSNITKLL